MPELPEVEVIRKGLAPFVNDRLVTAVRVLHPRAVRRHEGDLSTELVGARISHVSRRGKYLWFVIDGDRALVVHLGMSGQFRTLHNTGDGPCGESESTHTRIVIETGRDFSDDIRTTLHFNDQRTFGGMHISPLVKVTDGYPRQRVPISAQHIARDPLDSDAKTSEFVDSILRSTSEIKRVLLNQQVMSGVGNIYADEALWRAKLNGRIPARHLSVSKATSLVRHVKAVFIDAISQGGTSFDALYVHVNGESGYFSRSLCVYGRAGDPCPRCLEPIVRVKFMNRSSFLCPKCQAL